MGNIKRQGVYPDERVLLKLSGEALAGDKKTGFDEATVTEVARQVKVLCQEGVQVGIVIGGGNFWRGRSSENIDRTKADQIGMLATIMNCIYVSEIFRSQGMKTSVLTPFECGSFTKLFSKDRVNKYFAHQMVVFFGRRNGDIPISLPIRPPFCGRWRSRRIPFCWPRRWTASTTVIQGESPGCEIRQRIHPGSNR